ncbi:VOC family protein [Jannaschia marina]|uniref:VOC family protein n=1 Tax=Jannaschia marina TaxID=2741674 RepID=UPI0015CC280B|nr:VOC family protein [Jannaschia marina]
MLAFDHFAVSAATLEEGTAHVAAHLGHDMGPGGEHTRMGTHNRLSGLGPGEYLEVIAIDPAAPAPPHPRWFDLDRRSGSPRVGNWIARTDALDTFVAAFPDAGRPVDFERGPYRWRMAVPDDGILPFDGCFPAVIEWLSPAPEFPESSLRLTALDLRHPDPAVPGVIAQLIEDPRITATNGPRRITARLDTPDGPREIA